MDRKHIRLSLFTRRAGDGSSHADRTRPPRLVRVALLALVFAMTAMTGAAFAAVPGLQLRSVSTFSDSTTPKAQIARCPSGTKLIGTGGQIIGAPGKVVLKSLAPLTDLSGVSLNAGEVASQQTTLDWSITAHAICASATAVPGFEVVTAESPGFANSSSAKTATAKCPSGKTVIGGTARHDAPSRNGVVGVALEDITPNGTLTSVTATAAETFSGTFENWRVHAYAFCASSVAGRQFVTATSASDSLPTKSALARCPSGTKLIGTGGDIGVPTAPGRVVIDEIRPLADLSGVSVVATEAEGGTNNHWNVRAHAICATP